ncbi:hypothetical protein OFY17_01500 [Marinomonas sp. C2222]|uniref:Uncharacterized protein n=1 Tax=Marinomonas sargassi TaxID=2984494 RepID=A0ABT2YNT9_9GAMM|nr:hypothetical protein [Marinomonas sargassi]MCV2401547.1 hypothetical protein [Marinomonas sargassi]
MNIRQIVETQVTQSAKTSPVMSGNANFALMMSLFSQPGPSIVNNQDTLNKHEPHAITRPIQLSQGLSGDPIANIALIKALSNEPLATGQAYQHDIIDTVEQQIHYSA